MKPGPEFPNLDRDALDQVVSCKRLFVARHKLHRDYSRAYARLVLLRAMRIFHKLSGYKAKRFRLYADERELLGQICRFGRRQIKGLETKRTKERAGLGR
jgi:hypothetical protein